MFFKVNNVVVYALPAHMSEETQPLDVVMFDYFKTQLNLKVNSLDKQQAVSCFRCVCFNKQTIYRGFCNTEYQSWF